MSFERNSYLTTRAMKNFLIASILTMAVQQFNITLNGIIVSHLVGPDALSAINLYQPVSLAVTSFATLFGIGATIIASRAIGRREMDKVDKILSTAVTSILVVGVLLTICVLACQDAVVSLICHEERLEPYFRSYLLAMISFAVVSMMNVVTNQMVSIDGQPQLVTKSVSISAVINMLLVILFAWGLNLGIASAAFSTICAQVVNILLLSKYIFSKRSSYNINPIRSFSMSYLGANFKQGLPLIISNMVLMIMFLMLNNIIQDKQGADGIFVMSVCVNLLSLGMMFANGMGSTALSVGGFLNGQRDYQGLRILISQCMKLLVGSLLVIAVVVQVYPDFITLLFGANSQELIAYTNSSLRIFVWMLPTILLVIFLANVYQMLGYLALTPLIVLTFPLVLIPSMYVWGDMGDGSLIWYAFPETGLLVLLLTFVITEVIRFRKKDVAHLTLVPTKDVENCYDISVEANRESMAASLENLDTYLAGLGIGSELQLAVRHCIEEVTLNIVEHSGKNMEHHYFDIHTNFMDGVLEVIVKDDGRAFDPVALPEEERGSGLKILHGLCSNIDYKYMYGQNLTIMSWTIN